jgi:thiol-disulfide isomerase/thioredoxin
MSNDPNVPPPAASGSWLIMATVTVAAAGMILASYITPRDNRTLPQVLEGSTTVGRDFPPLNVQGWFNGAAPTAEDLKGQVLFVDAWAFWCGPCRAIAPDLKRLYAAYSPRGVKFLGLTSMDQEFLARSEAFIAEEEIPWPQAYGAVEPLSALEATFIPQFWIVGRDGKIVWDVRSQESVEQALDRALGGPAATPKP